MPRTLKRLSRSQRRMQSLSASPWVIKPDGTALVNLHVPAVPAFFAKQAQSPQAISGQPHFPYSPCNRMTPHTHLPLSINSQKTAKPASPRFAGHTPQPMPDCFPHASDPPYHYQAPKIPTLVSARPAFSAPQMSALRHPNRFPEPASGMAPAPPA